MKIEKQTVKGVLNLRSKNIRVNNYCRTYEQKKNVYISENFFYYSNLLLREVKID